MNIIPTITKKEMEYAKNVLKQFLEHEIKFKDRRTSSSTDQFTEDTIKTILKNWGIAWE